MTQATRTEVEDFIFAEHDLLDNWRLEEWRALFTADGEYHIVTPGVEAPETASPGEILFLVSDDQERLGQRVDRLMKPGANVEYPHSTTNHLVSNVRVEADQSDGIVARTHFITHRTKSDHTVAFIGRHLYRLVRDGGSFKIREKRCILDLDTLQSVGKVSIIL
jgi:p-cumate 2,3-dioxygenase beta subunit